MIAWLAIAAWATSADALQNFKDGNHLTARRLAEEALYADPDDFVAHYVVGEVFWKEEGNLPRALHHFKRADVLYTRNKASLDSEAWRTHWSVLKGKAFVAEGMEEHGLFFRTIDEYNRLYDPDLVAERAWALMKSDRLDEARAVAVLASTSDDSWQKTLGLNALCALEAKAGDRAAGKAACDVNLVHARVAFTDTAVEAYNASTAAAAVLDFKEQEALLVEASKNRIGGSSNPWRALASLYLGQGRGAEAIGAIQRMQVWRSRKEPADKAQSRASADAMFARVLLVAGNSEKGLEVIERALAHPDRRASTTASHSGTLAAHTLIHGALRRLEAQRIAEEASTRGLLRRTKHWLGSWLPDLAAWSDQTTLGAILTDGGLLARSLAPYEDDGVVPELWMTGDLIEALGPGVIQAAVDRGRQRDSFPGLEAYYDALEAEVAWRRGQTRTLELAERALRDLPEAEVLLRARVAAIAADHAHRWGDPRAAGLYERSLQLDPSALRRLGLALPARIEGDGSELDLAIVTMLRRSPRLQRSADGFNVVVSGGEICLSSPLGNRLGCYSGEAGEDPDEQARSAVAAFHQGAFALPLGLSLIDMGSLDGTNRLDAEARREALRDALGGLGD